MFLKDSLYSFCLSDHKKQVDHEYVTFGKYFLYYDGNTTVDKASRGNADLIVFGDAVDVVCGIESRLAARLLSEIKSIQELFEKEYYLGGKYVLFYRNGDDYYILGDATGSIPIAYIWGKADTISCASNFHVIACEQNFSPDEYFLHIRNSGDISQAMPFDYTVYKEIKQLLPNHYLHIAGGSITAIRFVNQVSKEAYLSPKQAAEMTEPRISVIAQFYCKKYDIRCPITAGRDSRVVLSFLKAQKKEISCYTIRHDNQGADAQDLSIPIKICQQLALPYQQLKDEEPTEQLRKAFDDLLGKQLYSERTLMIANTINSYCNGIAVVNGDIVGQVGKCSLHRDIPSNLATPAYFCCKLHNYSKEAKIALQEWMAEINVSEEMVNYFDIFSIENRMGRWASQENLIYNTIGQRYLNIFNSRSIVYIWTRVARKERKESAIHKALIQLLDKQLLQIEFENDSSLFVRMSKSSGIAYYGASFLKHWIEKYRFGRK